MALWVGLALEVEGCWWKGVWVVKEGDWVVVVGGWVVMGRKDGCVGSWFGD